MASFTMEEFLGDGALSGIIPKLVAGGWYDVPTVKMMKSDDIDMLRLAPKQKDALVIRSYLHDRSMMEYADRLEASGRSLSELLSFSTSVLNSQFGMKRGHAVRFINRDSVPKVSMPPLSGPKNKSSISKSDHTDDSSLNTRKISSPIGESSKYERPLEQSMADFKINDSYVFKGIVAAEPVDSRLCGCVQPPPIVDDVAPYFSIENISVQRLAPEYKVGMARLVTKNSPPMKASDLWQNKPTILICVRRPGCIMCRAEAHQLYTRKPIFDALGFQLIAVLHEQIESEVVDFWPRYWGGTVILDPSMDFFKALGGGKLLKDTLLTGLVFNHRAISNLKRAMAIGLDSNFRGDGKIKGGMFILGSGRSGIAYQFIEQNFGDWAPIAEVIDICSKMQNQLSRQMGSL